MKGSLGIVSAGHQDTANAAAFISAEGGNAYDACLAALLASCVAEPVLSSLGGGGFLMTRSDGNPPILYDFFAHTPKIRPALQDQQFYPIIADFGTAQQEFHIGMGSIAVPGMVRGLFTIHKELCTMPLTVIAEPAIKLAKEGVTINSFQHYISSIVSPIIESSSEALSIHESNKLPGQIAPEGATVHHEDLASTLADLIHEGDDLFYRGELAQQFSRDCSNLGGAISRSDLEKYRVIKRSPLSVNYHGTELLTNPAPSIGGLLIAFSLSLLERERVGDYSHNCLEHLNTLSLAMQTTQQLRNDHKLDSHLDVASSNKFLESKFIESYRNTISAHSNFPRGTTQISVADSKGNMASMTLSNGEGSGYVLPGTGIMLNNMLGEEDLNPFGFQKWPENRRIASMMAPTLAMMPNGTKIATGSGGSNRIRSAILQLLINLIDFNKPITEAVEDARIHYEDGTLHIEEGIHDEALSTLIRIHPKYHLWPQKNLFFGGAHTVARNCSGELEGKGDSRRGGVCITV
jgi:gamma-glutamyltranspeptidase/glutathione hydrolase